LDFYLQNQKILPPYLKHSLYPGNGRVRLKSPPLEFNLKKVKPNAFQSFSFFRKKTITSFFLMNLIDIPLCLSKSKSLYKKTFEIKSLRFVNFLMVHGNRNLALKSINKASLTFLYEWMDINKKNTLHNSWIHNYLIANTNFINQNRLSLRTDISSIRLLELENTILKKNYHYNTAFSFKTYLFKYLKTFLPVFGFFIQKINKLKKKHTKGKVEKLRLMWKYIPPYRRFFQTLKWLLKDLKFQKYKTLEDKLYGTFKTIFLTPSLSFLVKLKTFVHLFVFQKFKKTLLQTLKTTS